MSALYLLPAALLLLGLLARPLFSTALQGFGHYREALADPALLPICLHTVKFAAVSVLLELLLGMGVALLLDQAFRGRALVRAAALVPWALPSAVMAMAWRWIFSDTSGVANDLLLRAGLLHAPVAWLARPSTAFAALVLADVWKTTPLVAVLLLAGLQSVPRELHEAMSLDGASPARRYLWITLPHLRPTLALAATLRLIQALGIFDLVQVLTGGGPAGSTRTVALHLYAHLARYHELGVAAALTVLVGLGIGAVVLTTATLLRGKEA